ncbi:MAG: chemotaxis protein CheD [Pseudomonadota bacterium]
MTDVQRLHITQGEYATGTDDRVMITTLLGSCVSCCLWDPVAGVGGMNHMLLTNPSAGETARALSGSHAMEILINSLIKLGARRDRLQAKAFGGARMIKGLSDIGMQNAEFTVSYLAQERIPLVTQSLGGQQARNLRFWPATGRAMQKLTDTRVRDVEVMPPARGHGLELF